MKNVTLIVRNVNARTAYLAHQRAIGDFSNRVERGGTHQHIPYSSLEIGIAFTSR